MESALILSWKPTLRDALDLQACHRRVALSPVWLIALYLLSAFLLGLGLLGLARGSDATNCITLVIFGLFYPVFRPLERRWQVERAFAKGSDSASDEEWQISNAGLTITTATTKLELKWPAIRKVIRAKSGFALYVGRLPVAFLPRRVFESDTSLETFDRLIEAKVTSYRRLA